MLLAAVFLVALAPADLAAVGVVHGESVGVALLRSGGRTRAVRVGETAFGARVVEVDETRVVLEFEGARTILPLAGGSAAALAPAPARSLPVAAADDEVPAAPRVLPRADVEKRLAAEIPRILAETAVAPVSEGGRPVGVRLVRVAQGTLLTEVGLRPGDVLTRLNDVPTDSLAALMALWPRLQGATDLRASVLRDGRPVSLSLDLR